MSRPILVLLAIVAAGCAGEIDDAGDPPSPIHATGPSSTGWDVYFKRTYGNEVFLTLVFPQLPGGFSLGLGEVFSTPRGQRFDVWGVINDPDCVAGDASTDGFDVCPDDPNATGVIGIRKYPNPSFPASGPKWLLGSACAACHAGLDAENPPANPNEPDWNNIDVMPGNQFLRVGKIFGARLSPHDPRWQVFNSWPAGTVDTTAVWSDGISNTLRIAPITDFDRWPLFEVSHHGQSILVPRQEHSGQDDVGCELRSLRVWMSEGMCAQECSIPARQANAPIDIDACRASCAAFRQAESEVGQMCQFLRGWHAPSIPSHLVDGSKLNRGRDLFRDNCDSCHSGELHSDFGLRPHEELGVNSCAARSTNWTTGRLWANFSSDTYKARPNGGVGFVRTVELSGVWSSAPLLHNNTLGPEAADPSAEARAAAFEEAMALLLDPSLRPNRISRTTDWILLGGQIVPAGFEIWKYANADGLGGNRCPDPVEDKGHTYGSALSADDKAALIEYVKTL